MRPQSHPWTKRSPSTGEHPVTQSSTIIPISATARYNEFYPPASDPLVAASAFPDLFDNPPEGWRGRVPMTDQHKAAREGAKEWKEFPLRPERKDPPLIKDMLNLATSDLFFIDLWWSQWPTANIGYATGESGRCVLDEDKPGGFDDIESKICSLPETLEFETASGKAHRVYNGTCASGIRKLNPKTDTKSLGGYIVAPGSVIDVNHYKRLAGIACGPGKDLKRYKRKHNRPIVQLPERIRQIMGERPAAPAVEYPNATPDDPEAIAAAIAYLTALEPPDPGQRNNRVFVIAAQLKNMGLSRDKALELLAEHVFPRLLASDFKEAEATRTVQSAFANPRVLAGDQHSAGMRAIEDFADSDDQRAEAIVVLERQNVRRWYTPEELIALPPPKWLVKDWIPERSIGVLYGPSGSYKTFLMCCIVVGVALGTEVLGHAVSEPGKVFYIAAEDGIAIGGRLMAALNGRSSEGRIQVQTWATIINNPAEEKKLTESIKAAGPGALLAAETFSATFEGKENTDDVREYFAALTAGKAAPG